MKMDANKLARIREIAGRDPWVFNDERLTKVFSPENRKQVDPTMPYAGLSTFLRMPYSQSLDGLDIALVGIPSDQGVTFRPGARFGPQQVRTLSSIAGGPMHHQSRIIPTELCSIADIGDVAIESSYSLDHATAEIEAFFHSLVAAGVTPLAVGGDHSVTYPILKAVGKSQAVGLVHIDAHCDTGGEWGGSKFHHGGPMRNAAVAGVLDPERTVQIGIRGRAEPIWDFSYDSGMRVIHVEEFFEMGVDAVIAEARRVVGDGPTYISFDVDSIDPAFAPGTGTPEVGGLMPHDVMKLIRGLRGLDLVGADVVEVSPPYDPGGNTALVGATMLWELLCVLAEAISVRKTQ